MLRLLAIMLFSVLEVHAQWQTVNLADTTYFFEDAASDKLLKVIWVDSSKTVGSDTVFYFYKTMRDTAGYNTCLDTVGPSWMGTELLRKADGDELYYNRFGDSILICTNAALGQSWLLTHGRNGRDYVATISQMTTTMIDGVMDSTKIISIQAYANNVAVNDGYNAMVLEISKHHGWIRTLDMYAFPYVVSGPQLIGAFSNYAQYYRLPKSFNQLNLNKVDLSFKYAPGNEWIQYEIHNMMDDYTLTHDSIISFQTLSSNSAQVSFLREQCHVKNNPSSKSYSTNIITSIFYDSMPVALVANNAFPEYIGVNTSTLNPYSNSYTRWYIDTLCNKSRYLIKPKPLTAYTTFYWMGACYKINLSISGYNYNDSYYLPGFGQIYYRWEWGEHVGAPVHKQEISYPYMKLNNCTLGTKWIINDIADLNASAAAITFVPNPAKNYLRLSGDVSAMPVDVAIFNMDGKKVFSRQKVFVNDDIDISRLSAGVYFVSATSETNRNILKVVVTK